MTKDQIIHAITVLSNWRNSPDVMKCVGKSSGYEVIDTAIACLKKERETTGNAWIMYENKGNLCPNCMEHICEGWNFCSECGAEQKTP